MGNGRGDGALVNKGGDLIALPLPDLNWDSGRGACLVSLFRWIESAAISTLEWYLTEKRSKAMWSRTLRAFAVLFVSAGTAMPLVAVGTGNSGYAFWGYPILAAAAGCIGLDKACGFSSAWMRYLASAAKIQRLLVEYQLNWTVYLNDIKGLDGASQEFDAALSDVRQFARDLSDLVAEETGAWIEEFRGRFSSLEMEALPK